MPSREGQPAHAVPDAGSPAPTGPVPEPFGETANPAAYVPREATELALATLEWNAWKGRPSALLAEPGLGKTLVLHLLARRLAPKIASVFVPYAALSLADLSAWALGLLGEPPSDAPADALVALARARARDGASLLLLVDDANAMPPETARELGAAVAASDGGLRVVLAASDEATSGRVVAALHPQAVEVRLAPPMTAGETGGYLRRRLELAGAPPIDRARFDDATVERLHRLSGGVPRRVHELALALLREIPTDVALASDGEPWLGAPIDDALDEDLEPLADGAAARRDDESFFRRLLSSR